MNWSALFFSDIAKAHRKNSSLKLVCLWCKKNAKQLVLNPISVAADKELYAFPSDYCCIKCEKKLRRALDRQSQEMDKFMEAGI